MKIHTYISQQNLARRLSDEVLVRFNFYFSHRGGGKHCMHGCPGAIKCHGRGYLLDIKTTDGQSQLFAWQSWICYSDDGIQTRIFSLSKYCICLALLNAPWSILQNA